MKKLNVNCINISKNRLPEYETIQSAGCDLRANILTTITLLPLERYLVPCGIKIALPEGYEAQVRPRSGLALKHGITVLNTPGTIDADYRGQIHACIINLGKEPFNIEPGMRIAQMVISKYEQVDFALVNELDTTERGEGGHGSTGIE